MTEDELVESGTRVFERVRARLDREMGEYVADDIYPLWVDRRDLRALMTATAQLMFAFRGPGLGEELRVAESLNRRVNDWLARIEDRAKRDGVEVGWRRRLDEAIVEGREP